MSMNKVTMKSTLVAAAVALSCLTLPSAAQAPKAMIDVTLGDVIAAQGNAALRTIRAEMLASLSASHKPFLPARSKRVSAPAAARPAAGGSIAATAACAE